MAAAEIGVIGGSGFYEFLDDAEEIELQTPYGPPSDPLVIGTVAGRRVAFLPRHGRDHRFPPHRIPYRANLWALRTAGVQQVLAPCAVGGLQPAQAPGDLVVPDQLVDRTNGRPQTYHDDWTGRGAVHVSFADPYCPALGPLAVAAANRLDIAVHDRGTVVVVQGPRFSTRAESRWYAAQGWSLIGMTGHPEAVLARELALCYTPLALVTDVDAGIDADHSVSQDEVFRVFARNIEQLRGIVIGAVELLPEHRDCRCAESLDGLRLPFDLP